MRMHVTPIHAIIFDFGGVLINWDPRKLFGKYFANDMQAIDRFLSEISFPAWNLSQDKGYPFAQAVLDLSMQFPQYAHLIQAYDKEWEQSITGTIPGTVAILHKLKATDCHLYGLTNWSAEKFDIVRHQYKVFNLFEYILVSGEVKLIKPDPAIFNLFLQNVHHQAEECLLVDDSAANIAAARQMGFATHHFTSPALLELELQKIGIL
jgi:2-haloacid dehalogenase